MDLYKEIYEIGKEKNMNPFILFCQIKHGFHFGYSGFLKTICSEETKGQLNSESIYEVIVSPKMPTKIFPYFCPTKQTRIVAPFFGECRLQYSKGQ